LARLFLCDEIFNDSFYVIIAPQVENNLKHLANRKKSFELKKSVNNPKRRKTSDEQRALYIHIPFCTAKCRYCNFYSEPIAGHDAERFISALIAEMNRYDLGKAIRTVYIGGGSPSCLPREQLLRLVGEITRRYPAVEEFTIEVNPGQVEKKILGQLRRVGVNRLSIGAQSFTQNELKFLGRGHSVEHIGQAVREAKSAGFDNISLDLIFAIPGSTVQLWKYSLQSAIDLGVQHISAYSLTYEEGTPLQQVVAAGEVVAVDEEVDRVMYEMAIDELAKAGFEQYEISNFARKGFECRHNLVYWANGPYIGIGPGAGSHWQGERRTNIADIRKYAEMVQANADVTVEKQRTEPLEIACETAVLNLRRRRGIDLEEFKMKTGCDATVLFAEPVERYKKMGLIGVGAGRVFLTRKALPIADSVLCDFSSL